MMQTVADKKRWQSSHEAWIPVEDVALQFRDEPCVKVTWDECKKHYNIFILSILKWDNMNSSDILGFGISEESYEIAHQLGNNLKGKIQHRIFIADVTVTPSPLMRVCQGVRKGLQGVVKQIVSSPVTF